MEIASLDAPSLKKRSNLVRRDFLVRFDVDDAAKRRDPELATLRQGGNGGQRAEGGLVHLRKRVGLQQSHLDFDRDLFPQAARPVFDKTLAGPLPASLLAANGKFPGTEAQNEIVPHCRLQPVEKSHGLVHGEGCDEIEILGKARAALAPAKGGTALENQA